MPKMRLTRNSINRQRQRVLHFLQQQEAMGLESDILRVARSACRWKAVIVDFRSRPTLLNHIELLHDAQHGHWAETDGYSVWLNTFKTFTPELLYKTLLHEALHGMVRRRNGHELSETTEHRMMEALDPTLL